MFAYQGPIKFEQMLVHRAVREEDVEELEWHQAQAAVGVE
jgi:hypothetical protein